MPRSDMICEMDASWVAVNFDLACDLVFITKFPPRNFVTLGSGTKSRNQLPCSVDYTDRL
jgi:hypothetical protein